MFHAGTSQENEKRRQQYMTDLAMRADLDDRVLQAVKLNKRTGQSTIPLTDMRTLDEKMQDLERLKSTVRLDLLTITDPSNATEILESHSVSVQARGKNHSFCEVSRRIVSQRSSSPSPRLALAVSTGTSRQLGTRSIPNYRRFRASTSKFSIIVPLTMNETMAISFSISAPLLVAFTISSVPSQKDTDAGSASGDSPSALRVSWNS